jgi:metallophosphoesterase superfamily enzyme
MSTWVRWPISEKTALRYPERQRDRFTKKWKGFFPYSLSNASSFLAIYSTAIKITNHDVIPKWKFEDLGLEVVPQVEEDSFLFHHFPDQETTAFVFCGHVHPGVKLAGVGKQQLKLPCFYQGPTQMILPAFGAFTGLHPLKPRQEDTVFVTTGKKVIEIKKF